jgi:hypothetical protein
VRVGQAVASARPADAQASQTFLVELIDHKRLMIERSRPCGIDLNELAIALLIAQHLRSAPIICLPCPVSFR